MTNHLKIKDFNHFQELVIQWANERDMFCSKNGVTFASQFCKFMEEAGELGEGLIEENQLKIKDGIGDCAVAMVIMAEILSVKIVIEPDLFKYQGLTISSDLLYRYMLECVDLLRRDVKAGNAPYNLNFNWLIAELIKLAESNNLNFIECCEHSYNKIKNRKGKMINHKFVKEAE